MGQRSVSFSHRFSFQVELVGTVHESVEDGISQGRVPDDIVPFFHVPAPFRKCTNSAGMKVRVTAAHLLRYLFESLSSSPSYGA